MTVHHKTLIKFVSTIKSIHRPTGLDRGSRSACYLSAMAQWREILLPTHRWIVVSPARTGPVLPTRHWIVISPARTGPVLPTRHWIVISPAEQALSYRHVTGLWYHRQNRPCLTDTSLDCYITGRTDNGWTKGNRFSYKVCALIFPRTPRPPSSKKPQFPNNRPKILSITFGELHVSLHRSKICSRICVMNYKKKP